MKKLTLIIYFGIVGVLASSCEKYLDIQPDDSITLDQVFSSTVEAEKFLASVYSYLPDNYNFDQQTMFSASDDARFSWDGVPGNKINAGTWSPTNIPYDIWSYNYKAIRAASIFIDRVREVKDMSENLKAQYRMEARVLRAHYYSMLLRQYGPVIIIPDAIQPNAQLPELQLPRETFDNCITYVVSELDSAINSTALPDVVTAPEQLSRIDRRIARAIKARLLLLAASPLFNGNPDYAAFKNKDGKQLISQTVDNNKWKLAADAAKAVIDMMPQGLYKKKAIAGEGGDPSLPFDPFTSYRDVFIDKFNSEIIWAANRNSPTPNWLSNVAPASMGGYCSGGATQEIVDAYFMNDGQSPILGYTDNNKDIPILNPNVAGLYSDTGFSTTSTRFTRTGTFNMYVNREPRFYASITYSGSDWPNHFAQNGSPAITYYEFFNSGRDGVRNGGTFITRTGYVFRKLVNPQCNKWKNQFPVYAEIEYRLAEMYLDYAEALNEYDPGNPDIAQYINLIRERAGIPPLTSDITSSQTAMREAIRHERRVELAFDNHRPFDVRRWKILDKTTGYIHGLDMSKGSNWQDPAFFVRTRVENRAYDPKYYLWPIATTELDRNKQMVQNPGW